MRYGAVKTLKIFFNWDAKHMRYGAANQGEIDKHRILLFLLKKKQINN